MNNNIHDLISAIRRSYPDWPSTFGKCPTEACTGSGRGAGLCVDCLTNELSKQVGEPLALQYHAAIKTAQQIRAKILEKVEKALTD